MMDYQAFVDGKKTMVIAPAGYGKTYSIAKCLENASGKQLILTHTHAGISSIKEKITSLKIPASRYNVETISSFAQKYVQAFYVGGDTPEQSADSNEYHKFIVEKVTDIIKVTPVKEIIKSTYSGLFVDEYQDCIKPQHEMITALSDILPTHILGDHMQGIFDFAGDTVNLLTDLEGFERFPDLEIPYRWNNAGNENLGNVLKEIRAKLDSNEAIDLISYREHIDVIVINEDDRYKAGTTYNSNLCQLRNIENLLIIDPISSSINTRAKFLEKFKNSFRLLESIDDKDFYKLAKECDKIKHSTNKYGSIITILKGAQKTIRRNGVKKKERVNTLITGLAYYFPNDETPPIRSSKENVTNILNDFKKLEDSYGNSLLTKIIKGIYNLPNTNCYRKEMLLCLFQSLEKSEFENISVYEAMKAQRNIIRRMGRKITGKCIGTTLLTKGLEFDTVAILDAHKFDCPKHLYVALTRCCKKLIVFTNNTTLSPYKLDA